MWADTSPANGKSSPYPGRPLGSTLIMIPHLLKTIRKSSLRKPKRPFSHWSTPVSPCAYLGRDDDDDVVRAGSLLANRVSSMTLRAKDRNKEFESETETIYLSGNNYKLCHRNDWGGNDDDDDNGDDDDDDVGGDDDVKGSYRICYKLLSENVAMK